MVKLRLIALLAPLGLAFALAVDANPAKAVLYYSIYESAGGLKIETSGTLNLPAQQDTSTCSYGDPGTYFAGQAILCFGFNVPTPAYNVSGSTSFRP